MGAHPHSEDAKLRRWAIVRLVLGQAQVVGAAITFVLLLGEGATGRVICTAVLTGMISLASVFLFRVRWRKKPPAKTSP